MLISQECTSGYEWSNDSNSCVLIPQEVSSGDSSSFTYGPVYESTASTTMIQIVTGLGIMFGILSVVFCGTSAQDTWAIINFLQVILVLPLIVKSMSETTQDFIVSNAF